MTAEHARLEEARGQKVPWKKWGPYLSERQWGTVREDYSEGGNAWDYFSHDQARSRAYRWGEDGLVNPDKKATKAGAHYRLTVGPGECQVIRLRLCDAAPAALAQGDGSGGS